MVATHSVATAASPKEVEDIWMAQAVQQLCLPLKLLVRSSVRGGLPQHLHSDLHTHPATKQYLPVHPACLAIERLTRDETLESF